MAEPLGLKFVISHIKASWQLVVNVISQGLIIQPILFVIFTKQGDGWYCTLSKFIDYKVHRFPTPQSGRTGLLFIRGTLTAGDMGLQEPCGIQQKERPSLMPGQNNPMWQRRLGADWENSRFA